MTTQSKAFYFNARGMIRRAFFHRRPVHPMDARQGMTDAKRRKAFLAFYRRIQRLQRKATA